MKLADIFMNERGQRKSYEPKEYIVLPGPRPNDAYFIESGKVRQFHIRDNGNEVVVNVYGPGATLSLSWILVDEDNEYFFQALESTSIVRLPRTVVADSLASDSTLAYETLSRLVRGINGMYERLIVHGSNKSLQRVLAELTIEAKRFGDKNGDEYSVKINSSELAARTGMTREATSRALHSLEKSDVITIEKGGYRLKILDN